MAGKWNLGNTPGVLPSGRGFELGRAGYTRAFQPITRGDTIPVFAFSLKDSSHYTVYDLSDKLREHGWQVPAYTMPPKVDDLAVLQIVVREGFSRDMADMLSMHLRGAIEHLELQPGYKAKQPKKKGKIHKNC